MPLSDEGSKIPPDASWLSLYCACTSVLMALLVPCRHELAITTLQLTFNWISHSLNKSQIVVVHYQMPEDFFVARKAVLVIDLL